MTDDQCKELRVGQFPDPPCEGALAGALRAVPVGDPQRSPPEADPIGRTDPPSNFITWR